MSETSNFKVGDYVVAKRSSTFLPPDQSPYEYHKGSVYKVIEINHPYDGWTRTVSLCGKYKNGWSQEFFDLHPDYLFETCLAEVLNED